MSVRPRDKGKYIVTCDGTGCQNHYVVGSSQKELQAADDWLSRRGWRSIEGKLHYCKFCANKMDVFQGENP